MPYEEKKKLINPLVSVITPMFNSEEFILKTIACVRAQSYAHWEHIIVDDCSSDSSVELVRKLAEQDSRIVLEVLQQNKGASFARNRATEIASGDYIAFLDSDDLWHKDKLSKQIGFMGEHNLAVSYTSYRHMDESGKLLPKCIQALHSLSYGKQLRNNYVGNLTGVYSPKLIGKIMAPAIRKRQDWALWLEAIKRQGHPALGLQEELAYYRIRKDSISAKKWKLVRYNFSFYRIYLGFNLFKSVVFLGLFFWEYFFIRPLHIKKL